MTANQKPLGQKNYGSIGHLPGSRRGPGDHGVPAGQGNICTLKPRDKHDLIIVQEKLDGSNVGVARISNQIIALSRSGYLAQTSPYKQHQLFAQWVRENEERFSFLKEGERICGEWLIQAHGTRYDLPHEPFVVFDLMRGQQRALFSELQERVGGLFIMPTILSIGPDPVSIELAMELLGDHGNHGAVDLAEGAVWRVERKGKVDFLAKYVRPNKKDGIYLPSETNSEEIWNVKLDL